MLTRRKPSCHDDSKFEGPDVGEMHASQSVLVENTVPTEIITWQNAQTSSDKGSHMLSKKELLVGTVFFMKGALSPWIQLITGEAVSKMLRMRRPVNWIISNPGNFRKSTLRTENCTPNPDKCNYY
eukprot:6362663-Amphidinium_carterae.1